MNTNIQLQIQALRDALADNRLEVSIGDSTVKYKSNTDIIKALEKLESIASAAATGNSGRRQRAVAGSRYI